MEILLKNYECQHSSCPAASTWKTHKHEADQGPIPEYVKEAFSIDIDHNKTLGKTNSFLEGILSYEEKCLCP